MPDNTEIERTIYKLEIDSSGYIPALDKLSASTSKLTAEQEKANKALKESEELLKNNTAIVEKNKKNLDDISASLNRKFGDDVRANTILKKSQEEQIRLTNLVADNRKAYEAATKAATDFANVSARAANLQPIPGQGKIPTGPPPGINAGITSQIAGVLNVAEFTEQLQIIAQTKAEFDDLAVSITLAEERMKQLNAEDEEFKNLAPIVAKGKEALKQYETATKGAGEAQGSLRSQLRQGREDLVKLEQAGLGATKQYFELEKRVAKLTDEFGDQQARIKILASDTKLLDFGKGAITAATSAFQGFTAISILAGDESEELQKKTMQLFAAMQLLQSLEQLSNLTRREGVIAVHLQSASQAVYTAVVGASTGALKVFRLALLGTGIGAAIVLIGFLVSKWNDYKEAVKKAGENQKLLNDVVAEGNKESGKQIADLKILTKAVQDANIPMKERLEAVKQLQKEFPDYFGNLSKEAILTGDITAATKLATEAIIAAGRARAAKGKIDALENQQLDLDFEKEKLLIESGKKLIDIRKQGTVTQDVGLGVNVKVSAAQREAAEKESLRIKLADIKDKKDALARQEEFLTNFVGLGTIAKTIEDPDKEGKAKADKKVHEIQNEFERKKAELDAKLAELNRKEADNESKIRIEFAARLAKEQLEIEKLLKAKKLTAPQAKILEAENVEINKLERDKTIADNNKKIIDARQKLNDDLISLQNKNIQDQLNLIQDEFTRRAQLIEFNEQKELEDAKLNTTKRIAALELDRLLIGEKAYQDARALLIAAGELNALNIIQRFAGQRQDLSADMFQSLLKAYDDAISNANLILDEDQARQLKAAKDNLLSQKITYKEFQDEIKRIKDTHDRDMREGDLVVMKDQLKALDDKIAATKDKTTKGYAELLKQQKEFRSKIAKAESEIATDTTDPAVTKQITKVAEYAEAVGRVADSVIQFWQAANQAESQALDRSIALQEKRVDAAQRIAERGNAQYLKAEEDRLTELNIKRENAARKQLGIDAALQASQVLVGITGAISKIASAPFGAETIAQIAIIIGALATGYGLVKSLQGNQPKLREGTTDLKRRGEPAGVDTIPAWLNEHEAVIPAEKNKKYKKSVEAIYHGKVPAEVLNTFVENYVKNKKENKETSTVNKEKKGLVSTVHNIFNETSNKKITFGQVKDFIENKRVDSHTSSTVIENIFKQVTEKLDKKKVEQNIYSEVIDKVFSENKKLVEQKNLSAIVKKVLNETVDKNISIARVNSLVNEIRDKKTSSVIDTLVKLVQEKSITQDFKKSLVSDSVTLDDIHKYSEIINIKRKENIYKEFVQNVSKVPAKVLNSFIENYTPKFFKGTMDLQGKAGIDQIPIWATRHEAIIPAEKNNLYKPVINAVFHGTIPPEQLNSFVNNYKTLNHTIKSVPIPNYERIKEAAETHTSYDGRMRVLLSEHSALLRESNELQRAILQKKGVHAELNVDKNGVGMMVTEYMEQMRINKRV